MWRRVPPPPCRPPSQRPPLESPAPGAPRTAARRRGHRALVRRDVAGPQQGAEAQPQTLRCLDESGVSPLPSVVRTDAPVGQTPVLREWCTRDPLSAISALSPAGTVDFHSQDGALTSADVVALLEHLLREVPGRMGLIWEGSPIHRRHTIAEFLAHGAAQRLHLERLPADAPELHPDEGLWPQRNGVALRHVCCFPLSHLRRERRDAVKRVRRTPQLIQGFFQGAKL